MEEPNMTTTSDTISNAFRAAFESHPARRTDPGLALTSARETAAALLPAGVTGTFDDETLTFEADEAIAYYEHEGQTAALCSTCSAACDAERWEGYARAALGSLDGDDHEACSVCGERLR